MVGFRRNSGIAEIEIHILVAVHETIYRYHYGSTHVWPMYLVITGAQKPVHYKTLNWK